MKGYANSYSKDLATEDSIPKAPGPHIDTKTSAGRVRNELAAMTCPGILPLSSICGPGVLREERLGLGKSIATSQATERNKLDHRQWSQQEDEAKSAKGPTDNGQLRRSWAE